MVEAGCLYCTEEYGPRSARKSRAVRLEIRKHNYSGLGVDMATCPKCSKGFCITYKVDQVTHDPAWDCRE